jgi:hypothetical protein
MRSTFRTLGPDLDTYVYQLVDDLGDVVYYGISDDPVVRLRRHAATPPGPFRGMQVISSALSRPQALALETSLIQAAIAQQRFIYNIVTQTVSTFVSVEVPSMIRP